MEDWQRQLITRNLFDLIDLINCSTKFLASIYSQGVLSKEDVAKIESKNDRFDKTRIFLDVVQTRKNGFEVLLKSLQQTNQSGALALLLNLYATKIFERLKVNISDSPIVLGTIFSTTEIYQMWPEIRMHLNTLEFIDLLISTAHKEEPLNILIETIPTIPPYYILRTLSKRLCLNEEVFRQDCPDVFVIRGLSRYKLTELAAPHRTAYSSDQITEVTLRFIQLEHSEDWEEIRTNSKAPVHLINYEAEKLRFVLEETKGFSTTLNKFLKKDERELEHTVSEEEFINTIHSSTDKGICICDLPGMGKSLLLANLAHNAKLAKGKTVAFISLQNFINHVGLNSNVDLLLLVCQHITPSFLEACILRKLIESGKTETELFIDGFDEIKHDRIQSVQNMLKSLVSKHHLRIYVTSRPHMRNELEDTLGAISYDILPFREEDQIVFLFKYLGNLSTKLDSSKLKSFTKTCVREFKNNITSEESNIAGIPLQCRLFADVCAPYALKYCRLGTKIPIKENISFGKSMYEIYEKFICQKFSALKPTKYTDFNKADTKTTQIDTKSLKHEHHLLALRIIFPEISRKFIPEKLLSDFQTRELLSCGLLIETNQNLQFIHRTIAEYLIADFIVSEAIQNLSENLTIVGKTLKLVLSEILELAKTVTESSQNSFLPSLILQVLETKDICCFSQFDYFHFEITRRFRRARSHHKSFVQSTIVYFLDHKINILTSSSKSKIVCHISNTLSTKAIYEIIESCGCGNFKYIFDFITTIFKGNIQKFIDIPVEMLSEILSITCEFANLDFTQRLIAFFQTYFSINFEDIMVTCVKNKWVSPLQYACIRGSYDLLEYYLRITCSTEMQCLINICIGNCHGDGSQEFRKCIDMLELLLNKNRKLIHEVNGQRSVITRVSNFKLIKFLVQAGLDILASDELGSTIADYATYWDSAVEFHNLVIYLLEDVKAIQLFDTVNLFGDTYLHRALIRGKYMEADTIRLILVKTGQDINQRNGRGENVLFVAVDGEQPVKMLEALIVLGADYTMINYYGDDLLHFASVKKSYEVVEFLNSLSLNKKLNNWQGDPPVQNVGTPNQVAIYTEHDEVHAAENVRETDDVQISMEISHEMPKSSFKLNTWLGSGMFCSVFKSLLLTKGNREKLTVAMKVTEENCPQKTLEYILNEVKIHQYLGNHPNIVALKGVNTDEIGKGVIYIAMEMCEMGKLEDYLAHTNCVTNMTNDNVDHHHDLNCLSAVDLYDRIRWSCEISSGMEYCAEKKVVHGDLALRNIYLSGDKTAKIGNFKLSRRLYECENFVKKLNFGPVPWGWMPQETLRKLEFSSQSDVWSFGVTLWEIFSADCFPYPANSTDLVLDLESRKRIFKPPLATTEIFNLMLKCLKREPQNRPTFKQLSEILFEIASRHKIRSE